MRDFLRSSSFGRPASRHRRRCREASLSESSASARADGHGLTIDQVAPGSPAAEFGVATGDTLMAINGTAIRSGADLVQAARSFKGGDLVRMAVVRSGRRIELEGSARERPFETYEHASARYGALPFHDEVHADILVQPRTPAKGAPVVFLMQGFSCASVDSSDRLHPYRQIVSGLAARGIAVYRIEKPGMGDSGGLRTAPRSALKRSSALSRRAISHCQKHHGFAARQIFIFGHSLGGMEAPFIAARHAPPRGIAVYGVAARNWYDYVLDVVRNPGRPVWRRRSRRKKRCRRSGPRAAQATVPPEAVAGRGGRGQSRGCRNAAANS